MTDSIALGPDGQANHTLALLRGEDRDGSLSSEMVFVPGLRLHADPVLEASGTWRSPKGRLLEFNLTSGSGHGGWCGLHVTVPATDLERTGVLGFAARIAAPEMHVARACLRSGTPDGFVDCFFDKHLLFHPEEASHLDALPVHHRDNIPPSAPWREIVIFLPTTSFRLSVTDLRVFVV